ncbi:CDF family Co(II)/Ni(II) efflux transporter DmeF [Anaeromyxobacter oryzisoli]|uniref:CDF family Co(II)/Ni(II) efflux transporter DmeF n=1 Tax=Anaeromyxobacter oryzisoli TaxID=2925408 RepID=UPI001F597F89|nr:CDF family Co(II)/Ni(II) efflux transporter DmeF [Anaeromyxobacter sp. SG63]
MHVEDLARWRHGHAYGADAGGDGERRTRWVVGITLTMMVGEIVAGIGFGSMALLADGWHMGTHAAALGVAVFAYVYARKHAADARYSFGTGKVGALAGFASAVGLAVVALLVLGESVMRLAAPVAIHYDEAIAVAVLGLAVNLGCALLLRDTPHEHGHAHGDHGEHGHEGHGHAHAHEDEDEDEHEHEHDGPAHPHGPAHRPDRHPDHNRRAAYLHVLADALTSVLAIVALLAGRSFGWTFMDPVMGVVGSVVIARWSLGLLRDTAAVLLDAEVQPAQRRAIAAAIEDGRDDRVADLHVWRVGPRHLAAIVSVVTRAPREPAHYRARLEGFPDLVHVTVEVNGCAEGTPADRTAVGAGAGGAFRA